MSLIKVSLINHTGCIWPSSVLPSSGIAIFDFCHVLPKSGLGKTDVLPKSVLPSSGAPKLRTDSMI